MIKPKVGELFQNRYKILKELGSGGMGTVLQARQTEPERLVALKFLLGEKSGDKEIINRFYREFRLLSELSHPNIMTIYGLALDDHSLPFAICEFIEGKDLRRLVLAEGAQPWRRVAAICIQVCSALQFAHDRGVIHRDLKPENIMLIENATPDTIKVIDFGLSRPALAEFDPAQKLTKTGELLGTPNYLSPESVMNPANERSDIYALGCIMFELLSGVKLFDADTAVNVLYQHLNTDPATRFSEIEGKVPTELLGLLASMLAKSPENRPKSMNRIKEELEEIMAEPGELSSGKSFHSLKKQRLAITIGVPAAILLLVLLCFAAAKIRLARSGSGQNTAAVSKSNVGESADKELSKILDSIGRENRPWKCELLRQKAYDLCRSKRAYIIERDRRYEAEASYCASLLRVGLSVTAFNLCKETDADALAHDPAIMTDGISIYNRGHLFNQLVMDDILICWGQAGAAKKLLEDSVRNRNPGSSTYWAKTVENALILQDNAVWMKLIPKCPLVNDLVQISTVFRRYSQLEACATCQKETKKLKFRNALEEFHFQLESASVELASGRTQPALVLLKKASEANFAMFDLEAVPRAQLDLAGCFAVAGDKSDSIKYLCSAFGAAGKNDNNQAASAEILANLARTGAIKQLVDVIAVTVKSTSIPLKQKCVILGIVAERTHYISNDVSLPAACFAYYYYSKTKEEELPRETKLRCMLVYARALKSFGLPRQAIRIYEDACNDLVKYGLPIHEDSEAQINLSNLDNAKMQLFELHKACGDISACHEILKQMLSSLRADSPRTEILKSDYALGIFNNGPRLIEKVADIQEARQFLEIALRSRRNADAELALAKAKELLKKLSGPARSEWTVALLVGEAFLRLEQGQRKQALALLESISEQQLRNVPIAEQENYRDEVEFAIHLVRTS